MSLSVGASGFDAVALSATAVLIRGGGVTGIAGVAGIGGAHPDVCTVMRIIWI